MIVKKKRGSEKEIEMGEGWKREQISDWKKKEKRRREEKRKNWK